MNKKNQAFTILGAGSAGGLASWLLLTPDIPDFSAGDFYHVVRSILLGLAAAGVGVYFFPAADLRNFIRCVFFAFACGLGFEAILRGGQSMVEQIHHKDLARTANAATASLKAALAGSSPDVPAIQQHMETLVKVLPGVKDPDAKESAEEALESAAVTLAKVKSSDLLNSDVLREALTLTRFQKGSQAVSTLKTLRALQTATDSWAAEHGKKPGDRPSSADILKYLKVGSILYRDLKDGVAADALGNPISLPSVDTPPIVPRATAEALSDVADSTFWGAYKNSDGRPSTEH